MACLPLNTTAFGGLAVSRAQAWASFVSASKVLEVPSAPSLLPKPDTTLSKDSSSIC